MKNRVKVALMFVSFSISVLHGMEEKYQEPAREFAEREIKESLARQQQLQKEHEQKLKKALEVLEKLRSRGKISGEASGEQESAFQELPNEIKLSILGQLGNRVEEALSNIVRFSEVNTQFRKFLKDDPTTISYLIKKRFSEQEIKDAFKAILSASKYQLIKPFTNLRLLPRRVVVNLLLERLQSDKPETSGVLFKKLENAVYDLPIDPDLPLKMHSIGDALTLHKSLVEGYPQDRQLIDALYEYLISSGLIKINQEYRSKSTRERSRSPLYWAVKSNDRNLFDLLIKLGADPSLPVNKDAVILAKQKIRGWL